MKISKTFFFMAVIILSADTSFARDIIPCRAPRIMSIGYVKPSTLPARPFYAKILYDAGIAGKLYREVSYNSNSRVYSIRGYPANVPYYWYKYEYQRDTGVITNYTYYGAIIVYKPGDKAYDNAKADMLMMLDQAIKAVQSGQPIEGTGTIKDLYTARAAIAGGRQLQ